MHPKLALGALSLGLAPVLIGCGGSGSSRGNDIRDRIVASTRVTRSAMAVAGLAARITRAPAAAPMGSRAAAWKLALRRTRAADQGQDLDTRLYYTITVADDGSGRQDLFTDSARQTSAGGFVWAAPQWANGQPGSFPATMHAAYDITAGEHPNVHGEVDVTYADPDGQTGLIHETLTDALGDTSTADFTISPRGLQGSNKVLLYTGVSYFEQDIPQADGTVVCTLQFPDGSTETLDMQPDGSDTQTYTDPQGNVGATGDVSSSGDDTINYPDGGQDTVNVDTGDPSSTSGDSRLPRKGVRRR